MSRARNLATLGNKNVITGISTTARVGIGSTIPDTKLDVDGTVTATSFSGDGSGLSGLGTANVSTSDLFVVGVSTFGAGVGGTIRANGVVTFAGVVTATSFVGSGANLTSLSGTNIASGTVAAARVATLNQNTSGTAGGLTGSPDITVNNITGVAATFSGVLTYEDVTNVDSVGIVTARGGIEIGASGVGGTISPGGNVKFTGITTVGAGLSFADDIRAKFGAGGDLSIYHDGSDNYITGDVDGMDLFIRSRKDLTIKCGDNSSGYNNVLYADNNGTVRLYHPATDAIKLKTLTTGVQVTGVTSTTSLTVGPGLVQEKLYTVASALTGTVNFDVVTNGLVQYHTTNSSATFVANLRGDGSTTFNSLMHIGQTSVFTLYSAQNNTSYYMTDFQIDGSSITEKWNGGSAPSAGTGSGVDVYTFNIMKTANATFTVFATFSNFA